MSRMLGWTAVAIVCGAGAAAAGAEATKPPAPKPAQQADPRIAEADAALDEAKQLMEDDRLADAVAPAERALALREAVHGGSRPEVAECLHLLGTLHGKQGGLSRAETYLQRALAIREAALGKDHPDVASTLNVLALVAQKQGAYGRAIVLHQRALAIREAAFGPDHLNVASSLLNLGQLYQNQGLYDRAEASLRRALAIREAALGRDHGLVAATLNNLGILYGDRGRYDLAEPLFQRALAIVEARAEKDDPDVASYLTNIANVYIGQGLHARAESFFQRALAIYEAALGKDNLRVASPLSDLAELYMKQQLYGRAEPLIQRALAIREASLGKEHPNIAESLDQLAEVYTAQGRPDRAEPLARRALAIFEMVLGKEHPAAAGAITRLAEISVAQGAPARAEPLHRRALAIREAALGEDHPRVAATLNDLADLQVTLGRSDAARPLLDRAFAISERRLRREALDFSESRLAGFLQLLREDEQRAYALLRAQPGDAAARRLALSVGLLRKGRSVEELAGTSLAIYRGLGAADRDAWERLRGLRTQLARLLLDGPESMAPADYQQRLKALSQEGDALEAELAQRSAPLRALKALPAPSEVVDRVAAALPRDAALVELVVCQEPKRAGQLRYLALVLFPDARIAVADLGPAAAVDRAASRLRDALARREADHVGAARALHRLAVKPLAPLLGEVKRLFISPDGQLGLVPFAALHDGRQFLVDTHDFTYLTSGRDLLPRPGVALSRSVVVLADPGYSPGKAAVAAAPPAASGERGLRAEFARRSWAPLPGTRREAEDIQRLIPRAQLFLGPEATSERLLQLAAPGVLHLASHGFFLEDAVVPTGTRAVGRLKALGEGTAGGPAFDPLLRSGLVLAGAGLVTALEISGLDLWGTELVVLSACDTGRGDVKLGQGIYGLRRAFVIAGAETVVMSLWKVDDETTRVLMDGYYRNLLAGQGRASALREAMRALRQTKPHPSFWAPFIALGLDAPLRALQ